MAALKDLPETYLVRLSRLYESAPAYVTNQPAFLNAAALVETNLGPETLLANLKKIEVSLGRDLEGLRWGPRAIDLDIIFYGNENFSFRKNEALTIPHPRWSERDFVIAPLADLYDDASEKPERTSDIDSRSNSRNIPTGNIQKCLELAAKLWNENGGEFQLGGPDLHCVLPCGRFDVLPWQSRSHVMGIINVTPDSFSDGGRYVNVPDALDYARKLVQAGADILDVGGQSTRPGASLVSPEVESSRIMPVVEAISKDPVTSKTPISIDTFYSEVAKNAVQAGASIVNDVSGGTLDNSMLDTVSRLRVPYVLMHMRGNPKTMQLIKNTTYDNIVIDVSKELNNAVNRALEKDILPWHLVLDPGLGFAKEAEDNINLIAGLPRLRDSLPRHIRGLPLLLGPSRKGFLGKLTGHNKAEDRDWATAGAAALAIAKGANLIRAHNVSGVKDACKVADAVVRASRCSSTSKI